MKRISGVSIPAAALLLLSGCDWAEQAQGSHLPAIETRDQNAAVGFIPRERGPVGDPDSGLRCVSTKEIGAPYPMTLWITLGPAPGSEIQRLPRGGWNVGERYVPDQLSIKIDRQRFETLRRTLFVSPAGELILSGDAPQDDAFFQAIARARMMTIQFGDEQRTLAVAVWRKELIAVSEACEQAALAWQFLQ